ncbi:hypothetical protein MPER_10671, partial [Moniliophthora perniciosa FA553]
LLFPGLATNHTFLIYILNTTSTFTNIIPTCVLPSTMPKGKGKSSGATSSSKSSTSKGTYSKSKEKSKAPTKRQKKRTHESIEISSSDDDDEQPKRPPKKKQKGKEREKESSESGSDDEGDADRGGDTRSRRNDELLDDLPGSQLDAGEELLKERQARWQADFYGKYKKDIGIKVNKAGKYVFVFTCIGCTKQLSRVHDNNSTSNLRRHFQVCPAEKGNSSGKQTKLDEVVSKYNHGEFRLKMVEWITRCHRPDNIVKDAPLIEIFTFLNPKVRVFSPHTTRRDIKEVFTVSRMNVKKLLATHSGRFNLGFNGWTAPNWLEFLGLQVSFVREAQIFLITLDLIAMTEFGILKRTLGNTGDNASTNDKMLDYLDLELGWDSLGGRETQVRCFGHILNLIYQALMSQFEPKKVPKGSSDATADEDSLPDLPDMDDEEDDGENESDEELDAEPGHDLREAAREAARREIEEMADGRPEVTELTAEERKLGVIAIKKVVKLASRIHHNGRLQSDLAKQFKKMDLKPAKVVKRAKHRWNTMSKVVKRVIAARQPLGALCLMPEHNKGPPARRLKHLLIKSDEWQVINELAPILNALERTTEAVSKERHPLLHQVIPYIDALNTMLEKHLSNRKLLPCVRATIARALAVLDKYYSKTDESIMWKTAMCKY